MCPMRFRCLLEIQMKHGSALSSWLTYHNTIFFYPKFLLRYNIYTVKPVYNDHLYNEIYYLWFIQ